MTIHFERKDDPLLPRTAFLLRVVRAFGLVFLVLGVSLLIGVLGYHQFFSHMTWLDALLNASMILTGMGPVAEATTNAAKLFASFYALFSGIIFITTAGILFAPVAHRLLHLFHLEEAPAMAEQQNSNEQGGER